MQVLLCDDHVMFCEALWVTLRQRGHVVEKAHVPDDAVALVEAGSFDAVVMDLHFPDGDALAAIRSMTRSSPATAVVVLTAAVESRLLLAALEAGAASVCSKSQRLAEIVAVVERARPGATAPSADVVVQLLRRMHRKDEELRLADFLTPREHEVLRRLVRGQSTRAIADSMGVSYSTSRTHTRNVLAKLGVHTRLEAAAFAVRNHIVESA